jgi:hypothetical protein
MLSRWCIVQAPTSPAPTVLSPVAHPRSTPVMRVDTSTTQPHWRPTTAAHCAHKVATVDDCTVHTVLHNVAKGRFSHLQHSRIDPSVKVRMVLYVQSGRLDPLYLSACAKGDYSDQTGQAACKPCPAHSYTSSTGQTNCAGRTCVLVLKWPRLTSIRIHV